MKKIAIIGAGITGITTAYQLIKRGYDVTVFEKHRYPGMETSFANGGQLSASNADPKRFSLFLNDLSLIAPLGNLKVVFLSIKSLTTMSAAMFHN